MWLPDDLEAALAWQDAQRSCCPDCKNPLADTLGEDNENRWRVEAFVCDACKARTQASQQREAAGADMRGMKLVAIDRDVEGD